MNGVVHEWLQPRGAPMHNSGLCCFIGCCFISGVTLRECLSEWWRP